MPGLVKIERWFREAQLNKSLNKLCQALVVRQRLLLYKKVNARKQGPTTRTWGIINHQLENINVLAEIYCSAWNAMLQLFNGDKSKMQWKQLGKDDVRCIDDPELAEKRKKHTAKNKRAEAKCREDAGLNPLPGAGESSRTISWIWEAANRNIEYYKAYAWVRCWQEEILLLQEEMCRCVKTLSWQEEWWKKQAEIPAFMGAHRDGCLAYAHQQAAIKCHIANCFSTRWSKPKINAARDFIPTIPPIPTFSTAKAPVSIKQKWEVLSDSKDDSNNNDSDVDLALDGQEDVNNEDDKDGEDVRIVKMARNNKKKEGDEDEDDKDDENEGYLSIKERLVVMEEDVEY
ncbi:hypothetical protein VNI00_008423 [Paramarasmius palmivorus]|uniref:Uncharacterized protein n=1 Tax=Paramarasmius palmivorus TaxID=297713 RepID=A0AAW0CV22_9AGAR